MDTATFVLVIILSIFLAIFLVVGIVLAVYLIRLTAEIRKIATSAQKTVDHIESAVAGLTKVTSPIFVTEIIDRLVKRFTKSQKRKGAKKEDRDE
jgi:uncharacterized metal-binding protein